MWLFSHTSENQKVQKLKITKNLIIDWFLLSQSTTTTKLQAEDRVRLMVSSLGIEEGIEVTSYKWQKHIVDRRKL